MARTYTLLARPQSPNEEIANSVSHGIALLAAVAGTPILIVSTVERGNAANILAASVFASSMVLLYLASTLLHALPDGRAKRIFQILDHSAIYLLIAGTYTPFTLGVLSGMWGWALFGLEWGMAAIGITLKAYGGIRYTTLSTWVYIAMGWMIVIVAKPAWALLSGWGIFWLFAGGVAYTVGTIFFALDHRVRYSHLVWLLFVVAGTACHYIAVLRYAF